MKLGKTYGKLLAGLICLFGAAAGAQSFDFEKEHEACVAQRAYSAGGAAVGRCFDDQAAALDRRIETYVYRTSKTLCSATDRAEAEAAQAAWAFYRARFCGLVERSPENTPSRIQAGKCRLQMARERMEVLPLLHDDIGATCTALALDTTASRFGPPAEAGGAGSEDGLGWTAATDGNSVTFSGGGTLDVDTSACGYCDGGPDCPEGVFVLKLADDEPGARMAPSAALHVCSVEGGGMRLDAVALDGGRPVLTESYQTDGPLDWVIEGAAVEIRTGEALQVWEP